MKFRERRILSLNCSLLAKSRGSHVNLDFEGGRWASRFTACLVARSVSWSFETSSPRIHFNRISMGGRLSLAKTFLTLERPETTFRVGTCIQDGACASLIVVSFSMPCSVANHVFQFVLWKPLHDLPVPVIGLKVAFALISERAKVWGWETLHTRRE